MIRRGMVERGSTIEDPRAIYAIPTRAPSPRHLGDRLTVMRQRLCRPAHIRVVDHRQDLTPAMPRHLPLDGSFHIRSTRLTPEHRCWGNRRHPGTPSAS
jgi:hypothetical protein